MALLGPKRADRLAAAAIRAGGVAVIVAVLAIVADLAYQTVPLLDGARLGELAWRPAAGDPLVVGSDPRRELVWELDRDGLVRFPGSGREPLAPFGAPVPVAAAARAPHGLLAVAATDGRLAVGRVRFRDVWEGTARRTTVRWRPAAEPTTLPGNLVPSGMAVAGDEDGDLLVVTWDRAGRSAALAWDAEEEWWSPLAPPFAAPMRAVAVAEGLARVAVVDAGGALRVLAAPSWRPVEVERSGPPVAAVRYLIGGGTLVAVGRDGSVEVLLEVPRVRLVNRGGAPLEVDGVRIEPGGSAVLPDDELGARLAGRAELEVEPAPPVVRTVRRLAGVGAAPVAVAASPRRRGFLVATRTGEVALYHATSGRRLLWRRLAEGPVSALAFAPKADGLVVAAGGRLAVARLDNPHPEVSLRTLLFPVQYEGYAAPRWVWQTTGGSDSFEPKISLVPLLFGTLKASLFAMLFSVPLALASALYVSQLGPVWLRGVLKPTVELMAGVPSVVVGFLAALWLAPRLERALLGALVGTAALPLVVVAALALWRALPAAVRRRMGPGAELPLVAAAAAAVLAAAWGLAGPVERALFGGDFTRWLFTEAGLRYDQRNALVVGVALGFAVIPVIFTIAEDAFSAVPPHLVNAARALGATRWQTAVRLVAPAASAGVFAAVILGLGRAVGETMIVLMAAGNTPLLDLSPFVGMRTMSAAIAVEIPEAPVGGTLYRVLFLTGLLLFLFTLALTSAADLVGRVLRRRYGRF